MGGFRFEPNVSIFHIINQKINYIQRYRFLGARTTDKAILSCIKDKTTENLVFVFYNG